VRNVGSKASSWWSDNAAENLAGLRHMVLNMLRAEETKISIPMKQKRCMMLSGIFRAGFIGWICFNG